MTSIHYLIIGNGAAGVSAAEVIRQRDKRGRITILTDEPYLLYSRPGIAYVINGQVTPEKIITRQASFYKEHRFELKMQRVVQLDVLGQHAHLQNGEIIDYDVALLATGAQAVPPPFPGGDLEGVITFDNLDDAKRVIKLGRKARAAVVVGGGITAMELAEGLVHQKTKTHLLQRGRSIWHRLFNEQESAIIEAQIRHEGIEIHYQEEIKSVVAKRGKVAGVALTSGKELACQIVGVAIGVRPNIKLVKGSALKLDRGVLVNEFMQSSHPTLFAAGDVAQVYDHWTEAYHLDVLWPSAINEGRAAGYGMVDMAHGRQLQYRYQKGSPFNAAMLFGVHLTVIGQVGSGSPKEDAEELSYLSRGASNVWTAPFVSSSRSAWDQNGSHSVRLVVSGGKLMGALLMGNQNLADPLRVMIEEGTDVSRYEADLLAEDGDLPALILHIWQQTKQSG